MRLFLLVPFLLATLGNADIIKLVQAGLSTETIEAKIASSETDFDTSTDALVALANAGVADELIRVMIEHDRLPPHAPPAAPVPPTAPVPQVPLGLSQEPPPAPPMMSRRYDVTLHGSRFGKCEGELRVDMTGIRATRCNKLDFHVPWPRLESVCYTYGFRGTLVLKTRDGERRLSTTTPAEVKRIIEHIRKGSPKVPARECRPE